MLVGDGVDDGHRPGQREFELRRVCARASARLGRVHRRPAAQRAGDGRHVRLVAVVADAHRDLVGEVDAVDVEKAVDEMLARLLAVGDDVDAGILLLLEGEQRRVALGLGQRLAVVPPGRPQHLGLGQPRGFGRLPAIVVSSIFGDSVFDERLDHARDRASREITDMYPQPGGNAPKLMGRARAWR